MNHAFLIIAGTKDERDETAKTIFQEKAGIKDKNHPDLLMVKAEPSITIKQIRELQIRLALKKFQALKKVVWLPEAEKMTLPAQNAFLKTLESPPADSILILAAPNLGNLLPTIISRTDIISLIHKPLIQLSPQETSLALDQLLSILRKSPGERLQTAQNELSQDPVEELIDLLIFAWRELLLQKTEVKNPQVRLLPELSLVQINQALKRTLTVRHMLEANVHPGLALDNLLTIYPRTG